MAHAERCAPQPLIVWSLDTPRDAYRATIAALLVGELGSDLLVVFDAS